jgi:hypothetical protein
LIDGGPANQPHIELERVFVDLCDLLEDFVSGGGHLGSDTVTGE